MCYVSKIVCVTSILLLFYVGMEGVSYLNRIPLPRVMGILRQRKTIEPVGHNISANPTQH